MLQAHLKVEDVRSETVGLPSDDYTDYMARLHLIKALLGGTQAMREAGETYLPKEENESDDKYSGRKERTTLLNAFKRTGGTLTGQVFCDPIQYNEDDVPEEMKPWLKNIDNNGKDINRFFMKGFKTGINEGVSHFYIDFPMLVTSEDGKQYKTTNEETGEEKWETYNEAVRKKNGWRPYLINYEAEQIIGWKTDNVGGQKSLSQIRIQEHIVKPDPDDKYLTYEVEQVRVLEKGRWELWERVYTGDKDGVDNSSDKSKLEWVLLDEGPTLIKDRIPFYSFIPDEELTELTAISPLEDLAYLNLTHWQSTSEQRNILRYSRFAIWFGRKLTKGKKKSDIIFGPSRLILGDDPDSDLKAVEIQGHAIKAGKEDLDDIERRMSMFGFMLMVPKTGNQTATAKALDTAESDSSLKSFALSYKKLINEVMGALALAGGITEEIALFSINTEFKNFLVSVEATVIKDCVSDGWLPAEVAFEEFQRRGILKDEWDWVELQKMKEEETRTSTDYSDISGDILGGNVPVKE